MRKTLSTFLVMFFVYSATCQEIGVGYLNGPSATLEFKINKEKDELRLLFNQDHFHPINRLSILYQPAMPNWKFRPLFGVGPSVGYWRDRRRTYPADATGNSPWKKNPVIGLDMIGGIEYSITKRLNIDAYCHYSMLLTANDFGAPRLGLTLKWKFINQQ